MNDLTAEEICWLTLSRVPRLGPVSFWNLINHFKSAKSALENLPSRWQIPEDFRKPHKVLPQIIARELSDIKKMGAHLICAGNAHYPKLLKEIPSPPPVLTVLGQLEVLNTPSVALVGGRAASLSGQNFAENLASKLSNAGWCIASGLARGIDGAAHRGSLKESGKTIAVMASGLDVIYPREHVPLSQDIINTGALISEMPLGTQPSTQLFPRRNRIISGLSQGVIIVEAALKSGSLITARYALEQGREVFAVPGFPVDSRHHGSNLLLRQGAHFVESVDDILSVLCDLPSYPTPSYHPPALDLAEEGLEETTTQDWATLQKNVLNLLSATPLHIDELLNHLFIEIPILHTILVELELSGEICRHTGHYISRLYENKI